MHTCMNIHLLVCTSKKEMTSLYRLHIVHAHGVQLHVQRCKQSTKEELMQQACCRPTCTCTRVYSTPCIYMHTCIHSSARVHLKEEMTTPVCT